jgi:LPS O-antigen subunit length determinant protein (WzzB/FepE family)
MSLTKKIMLSIAITGVLGAGASISFLQERQYSRKLEIKSPGLERIFQINEALPNIKNKQAVARIALSNTRPYTGEHFSALGKLRLINEEVLNMESEFYYLVFQDDVQMELKKRVDDSYYAQLYGLGFICLGALAAISTVNLVGSYLRRKN